MTNKYDDILELPCPVSKKHAPMSRESRAAQFAPFAALTGYEEAVEETARLTDAKIELTEDQLARVNHTLHEIYTDRDDTTVYEVVYFRADKRKAGGMYLTVQGRVRDVNIAEGTLTLENRLKLAFEDILSIRVFRED